ncbi:hypothetical protein [Aliidiomarina soli]|uniref:Uncharacterized protein n=1 Tax=Aliidiomarina soli TaxID=1928574 RepID=A0A432WDW3_9GAMM|nr:hypothetical protein [Aliidiomarina soli]RUO31077.1 hypothetical protein CWE14_11270 [Aliidiomarina soli]
MSKWSPNAQLAALQFSGLVSLVLALQFLYIIVLNVITAVSPNDAILQSFIFEHFKLIPVVLGLFFLFRYLLQLKQFNVVTNWNSVLMILRDEYALSVYRAAGSKTFTVNYFVCFGFLYLSLLEFNSSAVTTLLNAQTVSATLMFVSSLVFGCLLLTQLHEEDE